MESAFLITRTGDPKLKPDPNDLAFGTDFTEKAGIMEELCPTVLSCLIPLLLFFIMRRACLKA